MGKQSPYTDDEERQMARIYESTTAGLRALTASFGGSLAAATAALRRQGAQIKPGGPRRHRARPESVAPPARIRRNSAAAHVSGETAAEIVRQWTGGARDLRGLGRIHGISTKAVRQVLEVAGLRP